MTIPENMSKNYTKKPGEMAAYEDHSRAGSYLIRLNKDRSCSFFVGVCADMCIHHHERYDGTGFPYKLSGKNIPDYTQLCSIAIEFDRLFTKRNEFDEKQFSFILKEMSVDSGRFNPDFIKVLRGCKASLINYYKHHA